MKIVDGQETVIKFVVREHPGGNTFAELVFWMIVAEKDTEVEIRGPCASACTLVTAAVHRDKLCFDINGSLLFHKASTPNEDGSSSPSLRGTVAMVGNYPKDIRAWINAKGGYKKMPVDGLWALPAPDLWKMGYRRCAD